MRWRGALSSKQIEQRLGAATFNCSECRHVSALLTNLTCACEPGARTLFVEFDAEFGETHPIRVAPSTLFKRGKDGGGRVVVGYGSGEISPCRAPKVDTSYATKRACFVSAIFCRPL